MSDLPPGEGPPGLRLGQIKQALRAEAQTQPGAVVDRNNAFNAALAQTPAPPTGSEASGRADLGVRPDVAVRSDGAVRADLPNRPSSAFGADASSKGNAVASPDGASRPADAAKVIDGSRAPDGAKVIDRTKTADSGRVEDGPKTFDGARAADGSRAFGAPKAVDGVRTDLPVLQLGSSDKAVSLLQRVLSALGYEMLRADAQFGPKTDSATRSFQAAQGLVTDGVVGNRQTWPALGQALVTRHESIATLASAMGVRQAVIGPQLADMGLLNTALAEFGDRTAPPVPHTAAAAGQTANAEVRDGGEVTYTVRGGETLSDVARMFNLPVAALVAANPELAKPYLILQGQLLILPNPAKERRYRRPPRQLHPADPDGHLAGANMNPAFVQLVNGMIERLRREGYDVRVIAGFRSFAEQRQRFEQGRRTSGKLLTNDEAGHSWHNYGLAVDIALNDDDGGPAWPEDSSPFWQRLGDMAIAHGAAWGGSLGRPSSHVEFHPRHAAGDAHHFIEEFESHGLEGVWARVTPAVLPEGV